MASSIGSVQESWSHHEPSFSQTPNAISGNPIDSTLKYIHGSTNSCRPHCSHRGSRCHRFSTGLLQQHPTRSPCHRPYKTCKVMSRLHSEPLRASNLPQSEGRSPPSALPDPAWTETCYSSNPVTCYRSLHSSLPLFLKYARYSPPQGLRTGSS